MYEPEVYKDLEKKEIRKRVKEDGFNPVLINNKPGYRYAPHKHPETKLLAIVKGSIRVEVEGEIYDCKPGDKLVIPGNKIHSAIVGNNGCEFFWSEKIIKDG